MTIPLEASVGWNWNKASKDNPDGLTKWSGSDVRSRSRGDGLALWIDRFVNTVESSLRRRCLRNGEHWLR
jgi:hypothetical protein